MFVYNPKKSNTIFTFAENNKEKRAYRCIDCKCAPWRKGEDFYVNDKLWKQVVPRGGIICIGCFEKRLGRQLTKQDFSPWFRKNRCHGDQRMTLNNPPSQRLVDRLGL